MAEDEKSNVVAVNFGAKKTDKTAAQARPSDRTKLLVFMTFIEKSLVQVRINTSVLGLVLPEGEMKKVFSILNFSRKFAPGDLSFDEHSVRTTLSFNRIASFVEVPWSAIFTMTCNETGELVVWPQESPRAIEAGPYEAPPQDPPSA